MQEYTVGGDRPGPGGHRSINLNNIATSKRICVLVPLAEWSSSIL